MFWIALAAQITPVQPLRPDSWFLAWDFPLDQLPQSGIGTVFYRATVAPDGRIVRCEVEASSGEPALDKSTCAAVTSKGRFKPAKWADGTPSYGVYRSKVTWSTEDYGSYISPIDVELTVNKLPAGVVSPAKFTMIFAADENGKASSCMPEDKNMDATLAEIACRSLVQNYVAAPARDKSGKAVASVQQGTVVFRTN